MSQFGNPRKGPMRENVSIFWTHFMMMICILSLAVIALLLSNSISTRSLAEENLSKMQITLERNCDALSAELYATAAIPEAIEGTRYYDFIRAERSGELPKKYISVLPLIGQSLSKQIYLRGNHEECLLYLSGVNSICSGQRSFPVAEDCFSSYLDYSVTTDEEILDMLRMNFGAFFLPMQTVQIGRQEVRCLTLITRPLDSSVSVMTLYSEQRILEYLGIPSLPEGTVLQLESVEGSLLYSYPAGETVQTDDCHLLTSKLNHFGTTVTVYIPETYFSQVLHASRMTGIGFVCVSALLGLLLCFLFSKVSVQPIRDLISTHAGFGEQPVSNEISLLDQLLYSSRQEMVTMQNLLITTLLAKAFSGVVLSEEDERQLQQGVTIENGYRVAVLHMSQKATQALVFSAMKTTFPPSFQWTIVSKTEMGILLPANEHALAELLDGLTELRTLLAASGQELRCGVSAPMERYSDFHVAVRQARITLPQDNETALFRSDAVYHRTISWLQHERLYQSILNNNEEKTFEQLQNIAENTTQKSGRETFYNVRFVIHSAADELRLPFVENAVPEYDGSLLARENILRLRQTIRDLFQNIRDRNSGRQASLQEQLIAHLREHYADSSLCTASVSKHFGLTERQVSSMVRSATNRNLNEFVLDLRMVEAAELLRTTRLSITEIARRCGYQADSTFFRVFKKYYEVTATQYRKEQTGQEW